MIRTMIAVAAVVLAAGPAAAAEYKLTGDNTKIEFVGKKPDGKHEGGFKTRHRHGDRGRWGDQDRGRDRLPTRSTPTTRS